MAMADLRVVGVTGSNGKTTTKDMIAAILTGAAGAEAVLKTEGNLNNHLGVPLTLVALDARASLMPSSRWACAAWARSPISTALARPDVALDHEHRRRASRSSSARSRTSARAKAEIFGGLGDRAASAIYPTMETLLVPLVASLPPAQRRTFGPRAGSATVAYDDVQPGPKGLRVARCSSRRDPHVASRRAAAAHRRAQRLERGCGRRGGAWR